jgi:hypothetical protein
MPIIYERTFIIEYNDCKITDEQKNVLAEKLQANDVIAHSWFNDNFKNITYGEYEQTETTTSYQIVDEDNNVIYENEYKFQTTDVFDQIGKFIGGLSRQEQTTETTSKKWKAIDGSRLYFDEGLIEAYYSSWATHNYYYKDEGVIMTVIFSGSHYSNITLEFTITWEADRVQRPQIIEDKLVKLPLNDMGVMQNLFETSLNDMGYDTEDAIVHCYFETKTETKSECSPDIVKMVRDARNKEEEE